MESQNENKKKSVAAPPEHPRALAKLAELRKRGLIKSGPTPANRSIEVQKSDADS